MRLLLPPSKERLQFCRDQAAAFVRLASKATSLECNIKFLELGRRWIHEAQQKFDAGGLSC
jgi:hypothetical protein